MKIDLYKLFNVKEDEIFVSKINGMSYKVHEKELYYHFNGEWRSSISYINDLVEVEFEKNVQFTDDELIILKNIDCEYNYIVRDNDSKHRLFVYYEKPIKYKYNDKMWFSDGHYSMLPYNDIFKGIGYDDVIRIDDYVDRKEAHKND